MKRDLVAQHRPSESQFQSAVIEYARLHGWLVAHFRPVRVQRKDGSIRYQTPVQADGAGFVDLVMAREGRVIFAELKRGQGEKLKPEQQGWIDALSPGEVCRHDVHVWRPDDWPEIERVLR